MGKGEMKEEYLRTRRLYTNCRKIFKMDIWKENMSNKESMWTNMDDNLFEGGLHKSPTILGTVANFLRRNHF